MPARFATVSSFGLRKQNTVEERRLDLVIGLAEFQHYALGAKARAVGAFNVTAHSIFSEIRYGD